MKRVKSIAARASIFAVGVSTLMSSSAFAAPRRLRFDFFNHDLSGPVLDVIVPAFSWLTRITDVIQVPPG